MTHHLLSGRRLLTTAAMTAAGAVLISGVFAGAAGQPAPSTTSLRDAQTVALTASRNVTISFGADNYNMRDRYNTAISDIRTRAGDGSLYNGIVRERPSDSHDYFQVHLQAGDSQPQVSLVMDAANLYVVGFYVHRTNIYYRMGDGPQNPVGRGITNTNLVPSGHYQNLQQQGGGFDRSTQEISTNAIRNAINTLNGSLTDSGAVARAVTLLITVFAEGARFDYISSRVSDAIAAGRSNDLGQEGQLFTTHWDSLSTYLRDRLWDGHAVRYTLGTMTFYSLADIARQLAVAYMRTSWRYGQSGT